ncbi:hypothetical protein N9Y42_01945 [Mariniblastus sp.]|nr:hypothetical protein [Mariniblastus sp.]
MKRAVVASSLVLFLASLPLTAYSIGDNHMPGIFCFALGWFVIPSGKIAWLANPLLIWTWFAIWGETKIDKRRATKQKPASDLSMIDESETLLQTYILLAALALGLTFFLVHTDSNNGAGLPRKITSKGFGYYLWLSSITIALVGSALCYLIERNASHNDQ